VEEIFVDERRICGGACALTRGFLSLVDHGMVWCGMDSTRTASSFTSGNYKVILGSVRSTSTFAKAALLAFLH
jgi:hypothetical protein